MGGRTKKINKRYGKVNEPDNREPANGRKP